VDFKKIKIIIHTNGGSISSSDIIVNALQKYNGIIEIYVPYYALSAGTFIALTGHKLFMTKYALLSQTDPQIEVNLTYIKDHTESISCGTFIKIHNDNICQNIDFNIMVHECQKSIEDSHRNLESILKNKNLSEQQIDKIMDEFEYGKYPHHKPFSHL
jgi:membrane-bound ClpP family serine protease